MGRFLRLFVVLLLPLSAVSGQSTPPPLLQPRPAAPSVPAAGGTDQITLDVRVTDKSGAPVRGLQKQDFTVLDDKQPQNILSFNAVDGGAAATTDPPVEIVLVVDAVNAPFQVVAAERDEVKKFLLRNGGKLVQPVSLVMLTDTEAKSQGSPSRDGNALAALYDQYETGLRSINRAQGFYGAQERFDISLRTFKSLVEYEATRPGRKLMIWISPGWPLLAGPNVQLSSKDVQQFFNTIVAASTRLRQASITVYSVDPLSLAGSGGIRMALYEEFLKGVSVPSHALPGDLGLQVFAVQTGGRAFNPSNDVATEIVNCTADADSFYVLSFNAAKADKADEYHALKVTVDKKGTTARTRTGYYAQP